MTAGQPHTKRIQNPSRRNWTSVVPYEIMEKILKYILAPLFITGWNTERTALMRSRITAVQPRLRKFSTMSYEFYRVASSMLYDEIYLSSSDSLAVLTQALTEYPHLRLMVHSLHFSNSVFRYGRCRISQMDASNIDRIRLICSNLVFLTIQRPVYGFPSSGGEILKATGLASLALGNLTHLQIHLPHGLPPCTQPILSPGLVLPALRELVLDVGSCDSLSHRSSSGDGATHIAPEHRLKWPRMPKLTRLCFKNLRVRDGCFSFPEHSKNIRIIELLGGDYSSARTFFHRDIFAYRETLESLVITASDVSDDDHVPFKLRHFRFLTEVCVPIQTFARWYKCLMPITIRQFVVIGDSSEKYVVNDTELLETVNERLCNFLDCAGRGEGRCFGALKHVRLMIDTQVPPDFFEDAQRRAGWANVNLQFGYTTAPPVGKKKGNNSLSRILYKKTGKH